MTSEIAALADDLLATRTEQDPVEAAALGLPAEDRLADLSSATEQSMAEAYSSIASHAANVSGDDRHNGNLGETDTQTLEFVRITAANFAAFSQVPLAEFTISDFHVAPLSSLLVVLPHLSLDSPERRDGYLARLSALPAFLEQAAERHREGVASGRRALGRGVRAAIDQIAEVVAEPDLCGLRRSVSDGGSDGFVADESRIIDESVLPAIKRYQSCLEAEILPAGRPDERPGLKWLPDGAAMYQKLIRFWTSTERSPEDFHQLGLSIIEKLDDEYASVGARLWKTSDPAVVRERLKSDPELRYSSSEEILNTAIEAVKRAELAAPEWFGLIPETECAVVPVPDALAGGSAAAYYLPGAIDGSRAGTFFVNTAQPTERYRHLAEAVAFHEAVPGHHFQLTIAQDKTDLPLARRVLCDGATTEGWGLYAERLADEMGLYSSDIARLGMLSTDSWRAARLVVDTGMHALGWSRSAAIDWMLDHVPMGRLEIETEIDRYIAYPAQALSYMTGRVEIEACRKRASSRLGDRFDVRAFHDLVLQVGPVPLPVLSAAVGRWADSPSA